jgi:phosphoglycerate dehydrogenase-like enzyme
MIIRILEPDAFPAPAIDCLSAVGEVVTGPPRGEIDTGTEALFIRLASRIDAETHRRYPDLRWIVTPTTGLDHIDGDYFAAHGVDVLSLRGRTDFLDHIHATAEHTLALALALLRDLPGAAQAVREGRWDRYPHKGRELHGKSVLLLGYGRIGRLVAPLYQAFGCTVRAHDCVPGRVPADLACDFPAALADTDILSLHLPLDPSTEEFLTADLIARLPARAIVVNTARGELVDQDALLGALERGEIAGAALDVLAGEPEPLTADVRARIAALGRRIVVTPHIAGFTHESLEQVERHMTEVFLAAIREQT